MTTREKPNDSMGSAPAGDSAVHALVGFVLGCTAAYLFMAVLGLVGALP